MWQILQSQNERSITFFKKCVSMRKKLRLALIYLKIGSLYIALAILEACRQIKLRDLAGSAFQVRHRECATTQSIYMLFSNTVALMFFLSINFTSIYTTLTLSSKVTILQKWEKIWQCPPLKHLWDSQIWGSFPLSLNRMMPSGGTTGSCIQPLVKSFCTLEMARALY